MNTTKKNTWGGKREGAGRKARGAEGILSARVVMCITPETDRRIKLLREYTKDDDMPFNRLFERWVRDLAKEYGID